MATFTQEKRLLTVSSGLGDDVLLLTAFSGREELSRLFQYRLELLSQDDAIAPSAIVGQRITWAVHHVDEEPRFFNGYVSRFSAGGKTGRGFRRYQAEVVPWLWLLTRASNCKIFQNKSAPKIIEATFDDFGFADYQLSLTRTPTVRDYCVQYRETAFSFVSRLMEEEGIFYYFKHEDGKHTLVLADAKSAYADCQENEVEFFGGSLAPNHISAWEHAYEYRPGKWTQTDYNFESPSTRLLSTTSTVVDLANISAFEMFDYPGGYAKTGDGKALTRIHMEEDEAPHDVVTGASTCCTFTPGAKLKLTRHECDAEMNAYVLTGVQHHATDSSYEGNGVAAQYRNTFTCIPASVVFRPARLTHKPFVHGTQTAVVVGPAGEEIYTDKYARIKVQFHWDRVGKKDENSSCWIRVSTTSAGKGWGILQIPRIGHEVVVDFLEGDPDKPIVIGCVYNAENMPAGTLPADKATSGMKSASTPGSKGFNQIFCTDTKNKEMITIHGQKDMSTTIEHDDSLHVKNHMSITVDGKHTETIKKATKITITEGPYSHDVAAGTAKYHVKGDLTEAYDGKQKTLVGTDRTLHVKGSDCVGVDGSQDLTVGGDKKESLKGKSDLHVIGDRSEGVDGAQSLTVGTNQQEKVGGRHALEAGQEIHLKAGMKVIIEAGMQLTLKGPGGFIDIGPAGVTVQGTMVLINSGGAAGSGSGSSPTAPVDALGPVDAAPGDPAGADAS
jgi:type VI secretion system secreted protein VgrG